MRQTEKSLNKLGFGVALATVLSLSISMGAWADSEAGFIMLGGGDSESGGVTMSGSSQESSVEASTESGGFYDNGSESESGGISQSAASTESGGVGMSGAESMATVGGNESNWRGTYVQYYGR